MDIFPSSLNFPLILTTLVLVSGSISLLDKLYFAKRRKARSPYQQNIKEPLIIEYSNSFFPVLFLVLIIRSFIFEPFRIPTGSLEPTLLVGDFIIVNKYAYGLRLPVINKLIYQIDNPKRGDIVVFHWPPNPNVDYIKRVIGVPGDLIEYKDNFVYVNGQKAEQEFIDFTLDTDGRSVQKKKEDLSGIEHLIYLDPVKKALNYKIIVPEGYYFVLGDNRSSSADSRYWGMVPFDNLVGKAIVVWLSWDSNKKNLRWQRFFTWIN